MNAEQWEAFWKWLLEELWPHEIGDYDLTEYLQLKKSMYEAKFEKSVPLSSLSSEAQ